MNIASSFAIQMIFRLMNRIRIRIIISCAAITLLLVYSMLAKHEDSLRKYNQKLLNRLERIKRRQERRKELINSICNSSRISGSKAEESLVAIHPHLDHFIVDDYHKIIYCYVPKIASTNWKRVLLFVNFASQHSARFNPNEIKGNESQARNVFKTLDQIRDLDAIKHRLQTYTKFMFVRNPFERILSAYRNKFESAYSSYFHQRFGRKIVRLYRSNSTKESLETGNDVKFHEYLQYLVELDTSDYKSRFNEHWRPIEDLCFPCYVNFDVIGKYETLQEDAFLVLWKTNFYKSVRFPKRRETYNSVPTSALLQKYYKSVPNNLLSKLLDLYNKDLKLFKYGLKLE